MSRKLMMGAFAAFTLGLVGLGFGARSASAEVISNERFEAIWVPAPVVPWSPSADNPCEPGTTPLYMYGIQHHVWYTTPDGTLKMNIQAHLTGTDADGTEYVANMQRHMEHPAWPSGLPFNDTFTTNLISKGARVNAQIVMTFDMFPSNPVVTVTACRG